MKSLSFDPSRLLQATRSAGTFDAAAVQETIRQALASSGLDPQSGAIKSVTDTIAQAMASAGFHPGAHRAAGDVIDMPARESETAADAPPAPPRPGEFVARSYTNRAGTRGYKLYVPTGWTGDPMPMVVMLHGCTQSPDDFAAGTQMNRLADRHGFLVVYPGQAPNANGSKCWNWFKPGDQARDAGEPSILAGLTREAAAACNADPRRIYVAGLSAGAAMAVILGETYPELYAGVGAHSGLPFAAAHDMPSAFAAMKGAGGAGIAGPMNLPGVPAGGAAHPTHAVPTIVFHGDRDTTVDAGNGAEIVRQAAALAAADGAAGLKRSVEEGHAGGRGFRRTVLADAAGRPAVEEWVLHGAGHAWSGGDAGGSYTDPAGPDASAEMLRFFLAQARPGSA